MQWDLLVRSLGSASLRVATTSLGSWSSVWWWSWGHCWSARPEVRKTYIQNRGQEDKPDLMGISKSVFENVWLQRELFHLCFLDFIQISNLDPNSEGDSGKHIFQLNKFDQHRPLNARGFLWMLETLVALHSHLIWFWKKSRFRCWVVL